MTLFVVFGIPASVRVQASGCPDLCGSVRGGAGQRASGAWLLLSVWGGAGCPGRG